MKKLLILLGIFAFNANAQMPEYTGGYQPGLGVKETLTQENYRYERSIIYVFYKGDQMCHTCQKAIDMLQKVYDENYANKYDFYKVDYTTEELDYNYTGTYNLREPLEVVLAKVRNGRGDGHRKIENLQNKTSNYNSFEREVKNKVDDFLD